MKPPDKEKFNKRIVAAERAVHAALRADFDVDSCVDLTRCLIALKNLVLEKDEDLPVGIEDDSTPLAKVLMVYDISFCCWRNDTCGVSIPEDAVMNHIVRMKLNAKHCKEVLDITRQFLSLYDRLLSVESASLRLP